MNDAPVGHDVLDIPPLEEVVQAAPDGQHQHNVAKSGEREEREGERHSDDNHDGKHDFQEGSTYQQEPVLTSDQEDFFVLTEQALQVTASHGLRLHFDSRKSMGL